LFAIFNPWIAKYTKKVVRLDNFLRSVPFLSHLSLLQLTDMHHPFQITDHVDFDRNGRAYCPSCQLTKGRQPSQKSLALLDSGAYKCHAGCSPEQIRQSLGVPMVYRDSVLSVEPQLTFNQIDQATDALLQADTEEAWAARQWLYQRGITAEMIRHYCLGLSHDHGAVGIQIPIPSGGKHCYRKVRVAPWQKDTAWNQKGLTATIYFTHQPVQATQTYLCEGEWDAILLGWAMRNNPDIAVATFTCGCNVVPKLEQLQHLPGQVVIFYDRDEPGERGAQKVAQILGEQARIAQVPCREQPPPPGWDISDALNSGLTVADIAKAARLAVPFSPVGSPRKSKLNYEQCLQQLETILGLEDAARQLWEINLLARQADLSPGQLRKIHQTRLEGARRFSPLDVVDFLAKAPEKREWIIAGKVPLGSTIALIADGGTGKSRLSYDLAYAVATGQPWNGFRTTQGKVLIIQTDEPDVDFADALKDARYDQFPRGWVQVETEWQFSQIAQLTGWIEQENPLLVIIDSFTAANRANELDEKDTNYGACIYDLRNIANTYGCTFLILHHTNKMGESRGTTAIPDNVSEVWYLRHPKAEDNLPEGQRILSIDKSRSRCSGKFVISFDPDDCVVVYHGDFQAPSSPLGNLEARLLTFFQAHPAIPYEVEELAGEFNNSYAHIRRLLKRLWRQGHILEEVRKIPIQGGKGGITRKKVYLCEPLVDDLVLQRQSGQGSEAPDPQPDLNDKVLQTQTQSREKAPDPPSPPTGAQVTTSPSLLKVGDWVEIQTGCFSGQQVEVVGILPHVQGQVEVRGKTWAITQWFQPNQLRRIRRATA
jgi:hypothetical protein